MEILQSDATLNIFGEEIEGAPGHEEFVAGAGEHFGHGFAAGGVDGGVHLGAEGCHHKVLPDDGRVISNFILQALQNQDITIYGDGSQTRSFQYIDDLIEGLLKMMQTDEGFTGPVNIGNPREFTIRELAERIITLSGASSKLVYMPLPVDDPKQRRPDITLAREMLDWEPAIRLDEGLTKMISYFRKKLKKETIEANVNSLS